MGTIAPWCHGVQAPSRLTACAHACCPVQSPCGCPLSGVGGGTVVEKALAEKTLRQSD